MSGVQEFRDLGSDALSHSGDLLQLTAFVDRLDRLAQALDVPRGSAVSAHTIDALSLDLQKVRDLIQEAGHLLVLHGFP